MRRREFIAGAFGSLAAIELPSVAAAQSGRRPVVGVLRTNPKDIKETFAVPFRKYMRALGWEEGVNIDFQFRWADGQNDRLAPLASELVAEKVDVLIVFGDPAVYAVQRATNVIPTVAMADDLVGSGFAVSLRRMRADNMTGVSILASDLDVKRLELLREFVPRARRIGIIVDPTTISTRNLLEVAARNLKVDLTFVEVRHRNDMAGAVDELAAAKIEAINILASPILNLARDVSIERLRHVRVPAIHQWPETAEEGGFLAYGPRNLLCYRHVVGLADKILRGAKPSDLPIEQPAKFELVLNLKAASELGLIIPVPLLLRADEVIE
jgi:putative tryptophan/tyrosine transport system substrate-binding protein